VIDEGFTSGAPCDGSDSDVCLDDMTICNAAGQEVCGNTSLDDDIELCNGADDDCDGEEDEDFTVGDPCDGADTDMCMEGQFSCNQAGNGVECLDVGDNDIEVCNMADEDCDGVNDNGFNLQTDMMNCGTCGNVCTAALGTNPCTAGACTPMCNLGAANCDGDPDNGCELTNTDPQCAGNAAVDLQVIGDVTPTQPATIVDNTERLMRIRVRETLSADEDITARFALTNGAGVDYDLFVYCPSCAAQPISDNDETIEVGRSDINNNDRSFDVWVEVRLDMTAPATTCASWTLTITGHVATTNRCAD
jgi:hypothetical protein